MNDEVLGVLLNDADVRLTGPIGSGATGFASGDFVASVRRRRTQQIRRRAGLGVLAVLILVGGIAAISSRSPLWGDGEDASHAIAVSRAEAEGVNLQTPDNIGPAQGGRLRDEKIARLKAEIAALDVEANRASRFVELYQAAEARRDRQAATIAAIDEALLPPQAVAELEIDRAAFVAVHSADAQANRFNRPSEAAESYEFVLKNFPDSRWAAIARARLDAMERMN